MGIDITGKLIFGYIWQYYLRIAAINSLIFVSTFSVSLCLPSADFSMRSNILPCSFTISAISFVVFAISFVVFDTSFIICNASLSSIITSMNIT
jgi:hypothetical protein